MTWAYYISPMMYGETAIVMNEFLDDRWGAVRLHQVTKSSFAWLLFAYCDANYVMLHVAAQQ